MDDMNDSGSSIKGSKCNEKQKAMDEMNDFES